MLYTKPAEQAFGDYAAEGTQATAFSYDIEGAAQRQQIP